MESLPNEIIISITRYLNYNDIFMLSSCNRVLRHKIKNLDDYYLHEFINNMDCYLDIIQAEFKITFLEKMYSFYNFINIYLNNHLQQYKRYYDIYLDGISYKTISKYNNPLEYNINLRMYIKNTRKNETDTQKNLIKPRFKNKRVLKLFYRIFDFYIENLFKSIKFYPNKTELIVLYNFIQIEICNTKDNTFINMAYDFLKSLDSNYLDLKLHYFSHMLKLIHSENNYVDNTFQKLYDMTPYVTNIYTLKKLIGFKVLDLSYTKLDHCCNECINDSIAELCDLRIRYNKDDLICHNYSQIRNLIKSQNSLIYNVLYNKETELVNEKIYIKNPITNRRMRVNGIQYRKTLSNLEEYLYSIREDVELNLNDNNAIIDYNKCKKNNKVQRTMVLYEYIKLRNYVYKQQQQLRKKFFT